MTARRDEAQKSIEIAKAKLQQIQAMIHDLTLVSPRNGEVQFKLKAGRGDGRGRRTDRDNSRSH